MASPQLCDGKVRRLADDVQERHLHAVDRRAEDLGVAQDGHQPLDVHRILADEVRRHESLDRHRGFEARMRGSKAGQACVGLHLDQHHQEIGLVATPRPGRVELTFEREVDHSAGDALDLHQITDDRKRADSRIDSSTSTKGSSYSMLMVPENPLSRSRPTNLAHHSLSWPRPTVAKFHGISSGGLGHRQSSMPLSASRSAWRVVSLPCACPMRSPIASTSASGSIDCQKKWLGSRLTPRLAPSSRARVNVSKLKTNVPGWSSKQIKRSGCSRRANSEISSQYGATRSRHCQSAIRSRSGSHPPPEKWGAERSDAAAPGHPDMATIRSMPSSAASRIACRRSASCRRASSGFGCSGLPDTLRAEMPSPAASIGLGPAAAAPACPTSSAGRQCGAGE